MQQESSVYCTAFGLAQKGQLGGQVPAAASGSQSGSQVFATLNAVQIPQPQQGRNFLKMSAGENHNVFLSDHLKVLTCGSNVYGQLGIGSTQTVSQLQQQINQVQTVQGQQAQQQISPLQRITEFVDAEDSQSKGLGGKGQSRGTQGLQLSAQNHEVAHVSCGAEHSFALSTTGELYSWGLNFKGQLGLSDYENRSRPTLVKNLSPSFLESGQADAAINGMQNSSKRSKSREAGNGAGGSTTREFSQTQAIQEGGLAGARSIFNATQKPSKSVDLTGGQNNLGGDGGDPNGGPTGLPENDDEILRQLNQMTQELLNDEQTANIYLLQAKEKVEQVECGSIHTMVRTNHNRIFSCGNGSTYALGHGSKETSKSFKQIQYFNGVQGEGVQLTGVSIKGIACGLIHSGCVLNDGSVYQWGTCGDYQFVTKDAKDAKDFLRRSICQFPTKVIFRNCVEQTTGAGQTGGISARRKSGHEADGDSAGTPIIMDIKMGEQFTIALSTRGYVYTWGANDRGQLGTGSEIPSYEPVQLPQIGPSQKHAIEAVTKIACGLKHCLVLTKSYRLYSWGSNLQCQLGKKLPSLPGGNGGQGAGGVQVQSSVPVHVSAYEQAMPIQIACGSYHNVILSRALPKQEHPSFENQIVTSYGLANDVSQGDAPNQNQQVVVYEHREDDCPNLDSMKKLKAEIKRLRQELIMKPSAKAKGAAENDSEDLEEGFSEEEKQAIRLLSQEQRKMLSELEQSGANREYIKKKIRACIMNQDQGFMYMMDENRVFYQNNEIPFDQLHYDRKLSEGGYGIVYRGRWKYTTVAIKEIKKEIIEQDKLEEFKNECAVMEVIRHPNIVLFLGACTKAPNLCIVLEYCSRGSLWSLLHDAQIKMSWEYRKKFALDIAKGVYYLHTNKQPILHRDLKSLNVLLDHALNCKLADFGWTRVKAKVMTSKIGTYQWMAPEVINGYKYTEKADVFSFGIILWELATRKPPYYGIDGQLVSQKVVKEGLRPKISEKEAPGPFLDLMKRTWHEDPEKRPQFSKIIQELENMNFRNIA